jgi:hypothetical protein
MVLRIVGQLVAMPNGILLNYNLKEMIMHYSCDDLYFPVVYMTWYFCQKK